MESSDELLKENPVRAMSPQHDIVRQPSLRRRQVSLRREIKIELDAFPVRRAPVVMPVTSFCAEEAKHGPEVAAIPCVALDETAAEKFVALTRRTGELRRR